LLEAAVRRIAQRDPEPGEIRRLSQEAQQLGELRLYQRLSRQAGPCPAWGCTITLPIFNRPQLLGRALASLAVAFGRLRLRDPAYAAKWGLLVSAEPFLPSIQRVLLAELPPVRVLVNDIRLGVRANPFRALEAAFAAGSRFNLHLEDDVVLSATAFDLVQWYERTFSERPREHFSYSLFADSVEGVEDPRAVRRLPTFEGYGWCVFAEVWRERFRDAWFSDQAPISGWDWQMRWVCETARMTSLAPRASRSNHIGRRGTYSKPQHFDGRFPHVMLCDEPVLDFDLPCD
jgi:hypothetical protein